MSARVKFLFDTDFASGDLVRSAAAQNQHHAALAEAEARGYRNGVAATKAEAEAETQRRLATSFAQAADGLAALAADLRSVQMRMEAEAVAVAVAVAGKLASTLLAREPLAEVEALAASCFRHLVNVPHVVIRVNDAIYDDARARLLNLAEQLSFGGRLIVLADPELALDDCRIEWATAALSATAPRLKARSPQPLNAISLRVAAKRRQKITGAECHESAGHARAVAQSGP